MKQMNFKKDSTPRLYFFRFQYQEMNQINIKHDCFAHLYIYIYKCLDFITKKWIKLTSKINILPT